jgi:anti-anti-sigma factor
MMRFKIDTKEKFTVITPLEAQITANMADEWAKTLLGYQQNDMPHLVINMQEVTELDQEAAQALANAQQSFYEKNCSCVVCCLSPAVEKALDALELLEVMNTTPTESEAWDIVQMEEIERELLGGEE